MKFEDKLKRLEEIVAMLESDQYGIESTLELFKEGMGLVNECKKTLSDIRIKVDKIVSSSEGTLDAESADEF
ncbi:MAG: exodeoxyribonuclease VII small subunit [Calditerrivibrio sp.]|nr:exodeoxyribonuclease VII small subunit [Calditerrivibrio sp.]MCA1980824.1 exodeoxyribonuclease VII small subunit [Calditerrivibrio sp.]